MTIVVRSQLTVPRVQIQQTGPDSLDLSRNGRFSDGVHHVIILITTAANGPNVIVRTETHFSRITKNPAPLPRGGTCLIEPGRPVARVPLRWNPSGAQTRLPDQTQGGDAPQYRQERKLLGPKAPEDQGQAHIAHEGKLTQVAARLCQPKPLDTREGITPFES